MIIHSLRLNAQLHFQPKLRIKFFFYQRKLTQTILSAGISKLKHYSPDHHTLLNQLVTVYILLIPNRVFNSEFVSFEFHVRWFHITTIPIQPGGIVVLCIANKWHQRIICASLSNNQVIIWHSIILIRHFCKCGRNQLNLITNCGIPFVLIKHCLKSKTNFLSCSHAPSLSLSLIVSVFHFRFAYSVQFQYLSGICSRWICEWV